MRRMHWRVFAENFNGKRIEEYDIFEHYSFAEDVKKAYRKHRDDFDAFSEKVRGLLFYYFCSKCEWEVIVGAWPPSDRVHERRVDVYEQVILNWDVFIEYVWTCCHERKEEGRMSEYIISAEQLGLIRDFATVCVEGEKLPRIVRCHDCKHYTDDEVEYRHYCNEWCGQVKPDGFCAWGERREDG